MYEQCSDTRVFRDGPHACHCILKQGCAQFDALSASILREPCEHHDRYRIRHVAPDGTGGLPVCDGTRFKSVIPEHILIGINHDEGPAGPVETVGQCTPFQPIVQ
ncbi:hypothetical protein J7371_11940 [Xanthomonas phaseoli pv. dieffenbachiae]|uniref:Uncharacterized protein n=1 Tax=Xanthomonas phaseoli pv. dieffenbachiae TaxID=92828 RepID=A0A1V9GY02_9XANT|nr:hypothetical protein [Xanthomonas phaseoli pv. dieffenbachiae]MBO9777830.1 hypothetical protein [Xanthomonas phaseoli pv. dieffenbachiae]MBO9780209.1 hypothetical protein [Xanthomonas phaseoli pv. dieffenbachiae]MBO9788764.1 hypothetical protein [Xanthomonas phaseoli pv. dieffenbachiae]MBO9796054.1 hypothetical protein [Xanthomonas phaseoli pv. dieffenbachiae]